MGQNGHTPLDICVERPDLRSRKSPYFLPADDNEQLQLDLLLLNNGACVTKAGQRRLAGFILDLKKHGHVEMDLDRIKTAPLLTKRRRIASKIPKILKQKIK